MQRQNETRIILPEPKVPVPATLYGKLMAYISKNTIIPKSIQSLKAKIAENPELSQVVNLFENSIITGNVELFQKKLEEIGNHPQSLDGLSLGKYEKCLIYLLYLIRKNENKQENKLDDDQAITVLTYLTALMSGYTAKFINLNQVEQDKKVIEDTREDFIESIAYQANKIKLKINENELNTEIKKLTGANAWLMIMDEHREESAYELSFLRNTSQHIPYIYRHMDENKIIRHWIPSMAVINLFLSKINPDFVRVYPIFGKISLRELGILHRLGYHPLQFNGGDLVKSNPTIVHDIKDATPIVQEEHDLYHQFSAALINKENHEYLYQTFIPTIEEATDIVAAQPYASKNIIDKLNFLIYKLADMDVSIFAFSNIKLNVNNNSLFFREWLNNIKRRAPICSDSPDDLHSIVRFYFELHALTDDEKIISYLTSMNASVAQKVKNFIVDKKLPIEDIKLFCKVADSTIWGQFVNLLIALDTNEENLQKIKELITVTVIDKNQNSILGNNGLFNKKDDVIVTNQDAASKLIY